MTADRESKKKSVRARKPAKPAPRPRGRPSVRTGALDEEVLAWIAEGKTLRDFCRRPGKPARRTIDDWREQDPAFAARFARARDDGYDVIAEQALAIADTPQVGQIVTKDKDGTKTVTEDMLGHRKLQVDTRLKLLAKWSPKKYGDKIDVEHTGKVSLEQILAGSHEPPASEP